jgi:hypothetical protein
MSILKKPIFHILSGIDGWSFLFIKIIDVNKVITPTEKKNGTNFFLVM